VALQSGAMDSDMALGWFSSDSKDRSPAQANFLGMLVGGPTRKGHMFSPACATAKGSMAREDGPALIAGKTYEWSLVYAPEGDNGNGTIRLTLDEAHVVVKLKPGQRTRSDLRSLRDVLHSHRRNLVRVYLDDLRYTAGKQVSAHQ